MDRRKCHANSRSYCVHQYDRPKTVGIIPANHQNFSLGLLLMVVVVVVARGNTEDDGVSGSKFNSATISSQLRRANSRAVIVVSSDATFV